MQDTKWKDDPLLPALREELARLERQAVMRGNLNGADSIEVIERLAQIDMTEALRLFRDGQPVL